MHVIQPISDGGGHKASLQSWQSRSTRIDSRGTSDETAPYDNSSTEDSSSRRSSNLSFMKTLLTSEQTSNSSKTTFKNNRKNANRSRSRQAQIIDTNEKLDVLVLLGNEKNVDKIETLTNKEYDLCNFRNGNDGYIQKISVLNPRIYYLNIDHDQIEREKRKKFDYAVKDSNLAFVDPFDRVNDRPPRPWKPRRSRSLKTGTKTVFRCVSRANPRNTLKNRDRTRSIHEHIKEQVTQEELENESFEKYKTITKRDLLKSAQRLSQRKPIEVRINDDWNEKKKTAKKMDPEELKRSAQRLSRRNPKKVEINDEWEKYKNRRKMSPEELEKSAIRLSRRPKSMEIHREWEKKESKKMDPEEMKKSVLRLSRLPKKPKEPENYKTGKVVTEEEIEKIAQRLYYSRGILNCLSNFF